MASIHTGRFAMLDKIYKIRESVDIYVFDEDITDSNSVKVQFYKINTRKKTTIQIDKIILDIIKSLDGQNTLEDVRRSLGFTVEVSELVELIGYLREKGLLKEVVEESLLKEAEATRYTRQVNYFDNLIHFQNGEESQYQLMSKKIVIFGLGATGATIASLLVRAGITNLLLIDPKRIKKSDITRHIYVDQQNIGQYKAQALADYLKKINSRCNASFLTEKLLPSTNLASLLNNDVDLVINTADEPYIGHITLKLGRYLWDKRIALYVSGGFDAHLMSSGELIYKGLTPCVDCCSQTFQQALSDWKPQYSNPAPNIHTKEPDQNEIYKQNSLLTAGGTFGQSLFSASFAAMNIIDHLLNNSHSSNKLNQRGEYLINQSQMTWFEMRKQPGCKLCGS